MVRTHIDSAVNSLRGGGVIAYPTEGVWGLGCDPFNAHAVFRILEMKQRPVSKGLIIVASSMEMIAPLLRGLQPAQLAVLEASWPGPNTWLLPDPDQLVPDWIRGKFATVAVRVSAHPVVKALCNEFDGPVVSTSANPAGAPPAKSRVRVLRWFNGKVDYVVPGQLGQQQGPSVIRDLISAREVRA